MQLYIPWTLIDRSFTATASKSRNEVQLTPQAPQNTPPLPENRPEHRVRSIRAHSIPSTAPPDYQTVA